MIFMKLLILTLCGNLWSMNETALQQYSNVEKLKDDLEKALETAIAFPIIPANDTQILEAYHNLFLIGAINGQLLSTEQWRTFVKYSHAQGEGAHGPLINLFRESSIAQSIALKTLQNIKLALQNNFIPPLWSFEKFGESSLSTRLLSAEQIKETQLQAVENITKELINNTKKSDDGIGVRVKNIFIYQAPQ